MVSHDGICLAQMKKDSDFLKRKDEVADFNSKHKWLKRGISMTHCRYVCSHVAVSLCKLKDPVLWRISCTYCWNLLLHAGFCMLLLCLQRCSLSPLLQSAHALQCSTWRDHTEGLQLHENIRGTSILSIDAGSAEQCSCSLLGSIT